MSFLDSNLFSYIHIVKPKTFQGSLVFSSKLVELSYIYKFRWNNALKNYEMTWLTSNSNIPRVSLRYGRVKWRAYEKKKLSIYRLCVHRSFSWFSNNNIFNLWCNLIFWDIRWKKFPYAITSPLVLFVYVMKPTNFKRA